MTIDSIPRDLRIADNFHYIDIGFVNRRICMTLLDANGLLPAYMDSIDSDSGPMARLANDRKLVKMVLDVCQRLNAPTLLGALNQDVERHLFRSTERLDPCPDIYESPRVRHRVQSDISLDKPILVAYHTEHIMSSTGRMILKYGAPDYVVSVVGILHDKNQCYEIEPMIMGRPWYIHPGNDSESNCNSLMYVDRIIGEILPEDIDEFKRMSEITVGSKDEWMNAMRSVSEFEVKNAFCTLLKEPSKNDWGGESDDHFSRSITINQRRKTASFLLKGPSQFREMTLDMCGKRSDQIHRMVNTGADVSIIQHVHLVGSVVRDTLRNLTMRPGERHRKYCIIDGISTYQILKAYSLLGD